MIDEQNTHVRETKYSIDISPPVTERKVTIEIAADQKIYIQKLYGPLAAEEVRIYLDLTTRSWIIERCRMDTVYEYEYSERIWEEKARWYCQETFKDDE